MRCALDAAACPLLLTIVFVELRVFGFHVAGQLAHRALATWAHAVLDAVAQTGVDTLARAQLMFGVLTRCALGSRIRPCKKLPLSRCCDIVLGRFQLSGEVRYGRLAVDLRSEEHTSELQSP